MHVSILTQDPVMNIGIGLFFVLFAFLLFVFFTFIFSRASQKRYAPYSPQISILVPAYNEERDITACLSSIADSDYPQKKIEILVIDDASNDQTVAAVKRFQKSNPEVALRLLTQTHRGKSAALNYGLARAKHDIVLTIDADTIIDKRCITELVVPLQDKSVGATNCISLVREPRTALEHFQNIEYYYNSLIRISFSRLFGCGIWFLGAAAAYKRPILAQCGGFAQDTLTEDMEISLQIYGRGFTTTTSEHALIFTRCSRTVSELFAQRMRWWFGVLQSLSKHTGTLKRTRSPSIWFLYINQFWWTFYAFLSLPLFIYQIHYWWPAGGLLAALSYLFRWFSLLGPVYVIYKIPDWGISLANLFGVVSGLISAFLILASLKVLGGRLRLGSLFAIFFYFPYTILMNLVIVASIPRYLRQKKLYFIEKR